MLNSTQTNIAYEFRSVRDFLFKYKDIWSKEIINCYPASFDDYDTQIMDELSSLNMDDLYDICTHQSYASIEKLEVGKYMEKIIALSKVEKCDFDQTEKLPKWAFNKVKEKKQHELERFYEMIKEIKLSNNIGQLTNIGGGMGHLSRLAAHYLHMDCIDIDMNEELQKAGKKRMAKFPMPPESRDVKFVNIMLSPTLEGEKKNTLEESFEKGGMTTGLHTCGPLSVYHMKLGIKRDVKAIINFGCCYAKLTDKNDINLSKVAKENPLPLTLFSLTLAARSHVEISKEGFDLKKRVKFYRFALHIYCTKVLDIKEFISVGNGTKEQYYGPFSKYLREKLTKLNIKIDQTDEEIDSFYSQPDIQEHLNQLFLRNIYRWQLGRVIEKYILLDRALYLEENGYDTKLKIAFEETISPRNIGIIGIKRD